MKVYENDHVRQVYELHEPILKKRSSFKNVGPLLKELAENLFASFSKGENGASIEISNYHPQYAGGKAEHILKQALTFEDAQLTIARAYGFDQWESISGILDQQFEAAVDALIEGKADELMELVAQRPELINQRSAFGHRATLLHYAGSNGVELWRQKVPENLPEIIKLLLKNGADKNATAHFYGGEYTTLALASSSAHPRDAGIYKELLETLS
ncbi:MAG: hypothetical protein ABJG47_09260 [Ekhidna sp.]